MESIGFLSTTLRSPESLRAEVARLVIIGAIALAFSVGAMLVLAGARSSGESPHGTAEVIQPTS